MSVLRRTSSGGSDHTAEAAWRHGAGSAAGGAPSDTPWAADLRGSAPGRALVDNLAESTAVTADRDGRVGRLMMNAELSAAGLCRIVVPSVLRNESSRPGGR